MQPEEKINILLVDDNPKNLVALEAMLEGLDQNLVKANSGKEALKHVLEEEFAVILLDVRMPDMDGFEAARLIRQREKSQRTPIIFTTAFSKDDEHALTGYSLGAVDYLFKPIVPEILKAKVSAFVDLFKKTQQVKKQAEELGLANVQLAESRAFLAAVLDSSIDAILTVTEDGIVRSANKQTAELFGYVQDELVGNKIDMLLVDATFEEVLTSTTTLGGGGGGGGVDMCGMTKEKAMFNCEIVVRQVSGPSEKVRLFTVMMRDITQRKRAENQLKRFSVELESRVVERTEELASSQAFLTSVLDSTDNAILTVDQHGVIESVNKAANHLFGYEGNELLGTNVSELLNESHRGEILHNISRIRETDGRGQVDS